jgi:hypothetical protein
MSKKVKKQASSMSFSLSRWFQRAASTRPSTLIVSIVIIGAALIMFGGALYDLASHPAVYFYYNQKFYFILTRSIGGAGSSGDQFTSETAISSTLYAFGFAGLLTIYQSSKHAYNPRQANLMLIVGVALLFLAYVFLEVILGIKLYT